MELEHNYIDTKTVTDLSQTVTNQISNQLKDSIRNHNVGKSNYSTFPKGYQPWDIWLMWRLNPWDADIIKRIGRTKSEEGLNEMESRRMDYEKIIHICEECIRQIDEGIYVR